MTGRQRCVPGALELVSLRQRRHPLRQVVLRGVGQRAGDDCDVIGQRIGHLVLEVEGVHDLPGSCLPDRLGNLRLLDHRADALHEQVRGGQGPKHPDRKQRQRRRQHGQHGQGPSDAGAHPTGTLRALAGQLTTQLLDLALQLLGVSLCLGHASSAVPRDATHPRGPVACPREPGECRAPRCRPGRAGRPEIRCAFICP